MKAVEPLTDIASKDLARKPETLPHLMTPLLRDGMFDDICELVRRLLQCRVALVDILDKEGVFRRDSANDDRHSPHPVRSFSIAADRAEEPIADATADVRKLANPLFAGEFGLRFYVGIPLRTAEGHNVGVLAALDAAPRPFTDADLDVLARCARLIAENLDLRLTAWAALQS